jgi:hypothetical protein
MDCCAISLWIIGRRIVTKVTNGFGCHSVADRQLIAVLQPGVSIDQRYLRLKTGSDSRFDLKRRLQRNGSRKIAIETKVRAIIADKLFLCRFSRALAFARTL